MKKTIIIATILYLLVLPVVAQKKQQETVIKREVTLYNPYKPSLPDVVKKSFLPDMTDTSGVRSDFKYVVTPKPFTPSYFISPIRPASLLPDPLPKLYNSYINMGFGNYLTPLAGISITNERSKKGAIGVNVRHFSTNGNVELQNLKKAFAGYMNNDASIYGRKFLRESVFESSVSFSQKTRYAYGYDTSFTGYEPSKRDIRLSYYNTGADLGLKSAKLDSSVFAYDLNLGYNFFYNAKNLFQHSFKFSGIMAKSFRDFYAGSGAEFDFYKPSDTISVESRYIIAINPFLKKDNSEWNVRLGFRALIDKGLIESAKLHIYPDLNFSFKIVPEYVSFFTDLTGKIDKNDPWKLIGENPFFPVGITSLYNMPNTDHSLIVKTGLTGNTGIEGNYQLYVSYSIVSNMVFYTNYVKKDESLDIIVERGNHFLPLTDDAEILNLHGEVGGKISDKLFLNAGANYYRYTLSENDFAWNRPDWDANVGLKYNLRNKIIAGAELNATGKRRFLVTSFDLNDVEISSRNVVEPSNINLNLSAEYRYTKIMSFWLKFNNFSLNRYYEWAYYPSLRFICFLGFTYSL